MLQVNYSYIVGLVYIYMENKINPSVKTGDDIVATEISTKYWNGKTSDHPVIQEMIRLDNSKYQICKNRFVEGM